MKHSFKALTCVMMLALPLAAFAADGATTNDTKKTTANPPKDATTYPCWDMMQDGKMQHMGGMMNGNMQMPPKDTNAHTCWDAMENGHMMHMRNMGMMWNQPAPQK